MKSIYLIFIGLCFFTGSIYAQDTIPEKPADSVHYKYLQRVNVPRYKKGDTRVRYRPTRLGSSSPLYDTYKKNKQGAGAITTNPNKAGSNFIDHDEHQQVVLDSLLNRGDTSATKHDRE